MAINGSNTFQWEPCVKVIVQDTGRVVHEPSMRMQTANTLISILGVSIAVFGSWKWADDEPVYRLPDGTLCDSQGNPL